MLVRLTSSTSGEMIMFAKHARRLFEIIGKECTARGVFTLPQLPEAILKLQQAVEENRPLVLEAERKAREEGEKVNEDEGLAEDAEVSANEKNDTEFENVHLNQRAYPLIRMMELTQNEGGFILWSADNDF